MRKLAVLLLLPVLAAAGDALPPVPSAAVIGTLGPAGWRAEERVARLAFSPDGTALWVGGERTAAMSATDGSEVAPPSLRTPSIDADGRVWGLRSSADVCALGTDSSLVPAAGARQCPGGIVDGDGVVTREPAVLLGGDPEETLVIYATWMPRGLLHVRDRRTGADTAEPAYLSEKIPPPSAQCRAGTCAVVDHAGTLFRWRAGTLGAVEGNPVEAATVAPDGTIWTVDRAELSALGGSCAIPLHRGGPRAASTRPERPDFLLREASLAFAPDGSRVAAAWRGSGGVLVVDAPACAVVASPIPWSPPGGLTPAGEAWRIAGFGAAAIFASDGDRLADAAPDIAEGLPPTARCAGAETCRDAAVAPEGTCACVERDGVTLRAPDGEQDTAWTLDSLPAPDGRELVSFDPLRTGILDDGTATVVLASATWRTADGFAADRVGFVLRSDGTDALLLHVPEDPILAISPDGAAIVAAGWAGAAFYGPDGGMPLAVDVDLPGPPVRAIFSPDGRRLALATANALALFAVDGSSRRISAYELPGADVEDLAWGPRELLVRRVEGGILRLDPRALE